MPLAGEMNGFDLARAIRSKQHPTLPVILATGFAEAAEQAATMFIILRKAGIEDVNSREEKAVAPGPQVHPGGAGQTAGGGSEASAQRATC